MHVSSTWVHVQYTHYGIGYISTYVRNKGSSPRTYAPSLPPAVVAVNDKKKHRHVGCLACAARGVFTASSSTETKQFFIRAHIRSICMRGEREYGDQRLSSSSNKNPSEIFKFGRPLVSSNRLISFSYVFDSLRTSLEGQPAFLRFCRQVSDKSLKPHTVVHYVTVDADD